jgi:hypothetical protein
MRSRNLQLGETDRSTRFLPGWWIRPGLVLSAAAWATVIWLIATR